MKDEFYVTSLLYAFDSERAYFQSRVFWQGETDPYPFIVRLAGPEYRQDIARTLKCDPDNVYEAIRVLIDGKARPRTSELSFELTETDLSTILFADQGRAFLAKILGVGPDYLFQSLFDTDMLRNLSVSVGLFSTEEVNRMNNDHIVGRLLDKNHRQILKNQFGEDKVPWPLVEMLVKDAAREKLSNDLGCSSEHIFQAALQNLQKSDQADLLADIQSRDLNPELDQITIAQINVRLQQIAYHFLRHANTFADHALKIFQNSKQIALLSPSIKFYITGQYKLALQELLNNTMTFALIDCKKQIREPTLEAHFEDKLEAVTLGEVLEIKHVAKDEKRTTVLRLERLNPEQQNHIVMYLPETVGDLSRRGESIGERILNTEIPLNDNQKFKLREALNSPDYYNELDDDFVILYVLSGLDFLSQHLKEEYGIKNPTIKDENFKIVFPKTADQIVEKLKTKYSEEKRVVEEKPLIIN